LAVNYLLLAAGEFLTKLLAFTTFIYLARVLGPARYGSFEFTLAVMVFFTLAADWGLGAYGAREVARHRGRAALLLGDVGTLRLILALGSLAVLLAVAALLPQTLEVKLLLGLCGLSLLATPALLQWFFQGHDLMHWVTLASLTRQGVFTGLVLLLVRPNTPLFYLGAFEAASATAAAGVCLLILRTRLRLALPRLSPEPARLLGRFRETLPIGLSELAWALLWYFATVLLGVRVGGESLGYFGASQRVVMAVHTFVWLYFFNLLPSLSRCVGLPKGHLLQLMRRSLVAAAWAGCFLALGVTLLARPFLTAVYGAEFAGAAPFLGVLIWMIPVAVLSGHYRYCLIAHNLQRQEFYCNAAAAAVSLGVGFALFPLFGGVGAALAMLAGAVLNFLLAYRCVRRQVAPIPFRPALVKPLAAVLVSSVLFLTLARSGVWLAGGAATLSYLAILLTCLRGELPLWASGVQGWSGFKGKPGANGPLRF
jgi:O-antigen/teichoic acid export membrane protein